MESEEGLIVKLKVEHRGLPIEWEFVKCIFDPPDGITPTEDGHSLATIKAVSPELIPRILDALTEHGEVNMYVLGFDNGYVLCAFEVIPPGMGDELHQISKALQEEEKLQEIVSESMREVAEALEEEMPDEEETTEGYPEMLEVGMSE